MSQQNRIKVFIVEDSHVIRELLFHILSSDPALQVVGMAKNGEEALPLIYSRKPDVITMDIHMPKMNGVETTQKIMATQPTPIIIVSASKSSTEVATTFSALEAGAVAMVEKPRNPAHKHYNEQAKQLVQTVKLMSEVKMVRRSTKTTKAPTIDRAEQKGLSSEITLIAVGASTGGPPALKTFIEKLPTDCPPVLVVQHITTGFVQGLAEWLSEATKRKVHIPTHGEHPLQGHIYLAPDNFHMGINSAGDIILSKEPPENGLRPAVSFLFRSVAESLENKAIGILLTGMGKDGAESLKLMKQKGAITFAQDKESSAVFGMPSEAIALNAATYVLRPEEIANMVTYFVKSK